MTEDVGWLSPMPSSVTVLMAVYNGERFLRRALDSLLAQTWQQFEVIVIDDGSTDATATILAEVRDARFSLYRNPQNIGLTRSLNRGLRLARGDYLARMDADDVALPIRLATQVAFLDEHREVGLVGSDCELIDQDDLVVARQVFPKSHTAIRWRHFFENGICHPTVMLRRSILKQHQLCYDERLTYAQDFDLWTRLLWHTRGENLSIPLLLWRDHAGRISAHHRDQQMQVVTEVIRRELSRLLGRPIEASLAQELRQWSFDIPTCTTDLRWRTALLMVEMFEALSACSDIDQDELAAIYGDWLHRLSRRMPPVRWPAWTRAALLRRKALPHWPRIACRVARRAWRRVRARMRDVGPEH
jgi:glycosyltransferase involved in cell wall biosynthesis